MEESKRIQREWDEKLRIRRERFGVHRISIKENIEFMDKEKDL